MLGLLSITISTSPFHIIKHKHASLLCSPLNPVRPSNTVCRRTPSSQHTHRRNPVLPINAVFRRTPSSEHTHHRSNTRRRGNPSSQQHRVSSLRFHLLENVWVVSLCLLDFSLISIVGLNFIPRR
ncbi:uncharacterized protein G2W53_021726 [Senna tora]|uniref:Uncharacterized protein n=1 Tax=Senna tora TaxID=362788 RepID=A0A834WI50_9FABA|nr:uncharacterized protein G2W53_021726 [Senna tora]